MTALGIAVCWVLLGLLGARISRALDKRPMPLWRWLALAAFGPIAIVLELVVIVVTADFWHKEL